MAHVIRYAHPDGLEEVTIATIAKEVLRGLEYIHKQVGGMGLACLLRWQPSTALTAPSCREPHMHQQVGRAGWKCVM